LYIDFLNPYILVHHIVVGQDHHGEGRALPHTHTHTHANTHTCTHTQQAAKIMLKKKAGRIINISSVVGQIGNPGQVSVTPPSSITYLRLHT
jgi:NAD(P)-dependent dehydrogenase (short-subunit alcohol dehydrogenase family)